MAGKNLAEQIKAIRARLQITQAQAAKRWRVNLRTLEAWESGRNTPRGFALYHLQEIIKREDSGSPRRSR